MKSSNFLGDREIHGTQSGKEKTATIACGIQYRIGYFQSKLLSKVVFSIRFVFLSEIRKHVNTCENDSNEDGLNYAYKVLLLRTSPKKRKRNKCLSKVWFHHQNRNCRRHTPDTCIDISINFWMSCKRTIIIYFPTLCNWCIVIVINSSVSLCN